MTVVCILTALAALAAVVFASAGMRNRLSGKGRAQGGNDGIPPAVGAPQECCGRHEVCERLSLPTAEDGQAEYYDDEELDRFRDKDASAYSETETEEFRDILYTMREDEVSGWVRSLQLRGISLPDALKDEVLLIIGERRAGHA